MDCVGELPTATQDVADGQATALSCVLVWLRMSWGRHVVPEFTLLSTAPLSLVPFPCDPTMMQIVAAAQSMPLGTKQCVGVVVQDFPALVVV